MISDVFKRDIKKEEMLFLSLCSREDKLKLEKKIPLTYNDYLRITCILTHMNFVLYELKVNELFQEYHTMKKQMMIRHKDILKEYPDYYKDEAVDIKIHNWLLEFCSQIPDKHQQKKFIKKFDLE